MSEIKISCLCCNNTWISLELSHSMWCNLHTDVAAQQWVSSPANGATFLPLEYLVGDSGISRELFLSRLAPSHQGLSPHPWPFTCQLKLPSELSIYLTIKNYSKHITPSPASRSLSPCSASYPHYNASTSPPPGTSTPTHKSPQWPHTSPYIPTHN